jgi:hypothetical protein
MTVVARRKWEGVLSLVWVAPGFVAFEFFRVEWWGLFDCGSPVLVFLAIFGLWWGVGLLLAASGLRSSATISVLASAGTVLWFVFFLWDLLVPHFHT